MQQPTQAPPPPAQPTPPAPPVAPAPPKKSSALKWVLIIILVIVIIIILAFAGCWFVGKRAVKTLEKEAAKLEEQIPKITVPEGVTEEEVTLPSADVTGKDITGIPRYSGSVRTAWSKDESSETVSYQVKATVAKVKDYYTKLLAEKGWTLTSSTEFILDFDKEPAHCTIILYDTDGSTTYSISYWPEW